MRVLHINSGNLYGGVERVLATLAGNRHLCPQMEPHFALCFPGRQYDELAHLGVPLHLLGAVRIRWPWSVWRARRALEGALLRKPMDLVVSHSAWSQAIFGPVVRRLGVPLVFWLHSCSTGQHWLERWAGRTKPDLVLCVSRSAQETACHLFPGVPSEVCYSPVVPVAGISEGQRASVRKELSTAANAVVIIQVSRMEELKGQIVHLQALRLLRDLKDWRVWFVGGVQRGCEKLYQLKLESLRNEAEKGPPHGLVDALKRLFQLKD